MPTTDRLTVITQGDLHHHPGHAEHMRLALADIEAGLRALAARGYVFHLEPGPAPPDEYPRVMYHVSAPPRQVSCDADVLDLGPGWYPTPQEAARAAGIVHQFQGRGGVGLTAGLAVVMPHATRNGLGGVSEAYKPEANALREANREAFAARPPMETK